MSQVRIRLTMVGALGLTGLIVGLLLLFMTTGAASAAGLVMSVLAVAFLVADQLPSGLTGGFVVGARAPQRTPPDPEPEYIDKAAVPSDAAWQQEAERYRAEGSS